MSDIDDFSAVIEGLYRSALDPRAWPGAMQQLVSYVDGSATFYLSSDPRTGNIIRSELTGLDPLVNQLYLLHFADKEVRIPGSLRFDVGEVVTEQEIIDARAFRRSEIFNDLLKPFDIPYVMSFCTQRSPIESANFVVERSFRQGPFEREQIERLRRLVPHLRLALQLRTICDEVAASTRAMSSWLEDQRYALVSLDAHGRVLELSSVARELVYQERFINVSLGRLRARCAAEDSALSAAVRDAIHPPAGRMPRGARVILSSERAKATADVLPMRDFNLAGDERAVVVVILRSLTLATPASQDIQTALKVTKAEARLVREVFASGQLHDAACELGVSINTARSQLQSVFAKTGCRNQVELIRSIASLASGFPCETEPLTIRQP